MELGLVIKLRSLSVRTTHEKGRETRQLLFGQVYWSLPNKTREDSLLCGHTNWALTKQLTVQSYQLGKAQPGV